MSDHYAKYNPRYAERYALREDSQKHGGRARTQQSQQRQISTPFVECVREPDKNTHCGTQHHDEREHLQRGERDAEQAKQACDFERRCGSLHRAACIDPARERRGGQWCRVLNEVRGDFLHLAFVPTRVRVVLIVILTVILIVTLGQFTGDNRYGGYISVFMHFPYTFNCREHDAVDDSPSGLKNADNGVRVIGVAAAAFGQTVRPCKNIAHHEAGCARDLSTDYDFLRHAPHPTRLQRGAIKLHIRWTGADDAKSLIAIAQR